MTGYCTKCEINWAALWYQDDEDERYYYCPLCYNDMLLEQVKAGPSYSRCEFTGKVHEVITWKVLDIPSSVVPAPPRKYKVFTETYDEWQIRKELAEDRWIDHYRATGVVGVREKIIRKFTYE